MTTIGIIGSGHIGITVAQLAVEAGHQVVLSNSRGPETLADTAAELGPSSTRATTDLSATGTSPNSPTTRSPRANCCCDTSRTPCR